MPSLGAGETRIPVRLTLATRKSSEHQAASLYVRSRGELDADFPDLGGIKEQLSAASLLFTHPWDAAFTSTQHE
jgi:hypothetical protein